MQRPQLLSRMLGSTLLLTLVLVISACSGFAPETSSSNNEKTITVAGKLDTEAQLLTKMYSLLLRKAGFNVNEKPAFGDTTTNDRAIKNGEIDLYAEFTGTGLNQLKIASTYDPEQDYQAVKKAYEEQFQIVWLNRAVNHNNGYALCMKEDKAKELNISKLSDLATQVSELNFVTPSDGEDFVNNLKQTYNFDGSSFKSKKQVQYAIAVESVVQGDAEVAICYTTDVGIGAAGLIFLEDDKNGFPAFNPAPIVRKEVLDKYPEIADVLNPLAERLTTEKSIELQTKVEEKKQSTSATQAIEEVATEFLKQEGLL